MASFYMASGSWVFPSNSGAFICEAPPTSVASLNPTTTGVPLAQQATMNSQYGVLLQYDQSKQLSLIEDATVIAFLGRSAPALEIGQMLFDQIALGYRWPPNCGAFGPTISTPGGVSVEKAIRGILNQQHNGSLVCYQDAKGRVFLGALLSVSLQDLIEPSGWLALTATFYQTWGTFYVPAT